MPERYELRAVFEVEYPENLIKYARRRHRECYPPGTENAPPRPRDIASALTDSLIDCKEEPSVEDLGLVYLESVSGAISEEEESVLAAVRALYVRTGGQGPLWDGLRKLLEGMFEIGCRSRRRRPK